ncbi:hypothetical protein ACFYM2_18730 [Streptomyces sp. NPDC006711]|uniref:hypothetical protein n=1 Tax=unclassified Streptomyces TaxID=2593676 RepID=UPI0033DB38B4
MRHHKTTTAAAALAAGVLLLTGCGGGGTKGGDAKKIAGADSGPSASATPSTSASAAADAADRPKVTLPEGDSLIFEPEAVGDPTTDAILKDNAEYLRAIDEAIGKQDLKSKSVAFYAKDDALMGTTKWIGGFITDNTTVTGTVRYFNRKVTMSQDGSASLIYCADETKGFTKDRKTGKVDVTPPSKNSYVYYSDRWRKNDKGVWQVTTSTSERGKQSCQP